MLRADRNRVTVSVVERDRQAPAIDAARDLPRAVLMRESDLALDLTHVVLVRASEQAFHGIHDVRAHVFDLSYHGANAARTSNDRVNSRGGCHTLASSN